MAKETNNKLIIGKIRKSDFGSAGSRRVLKSGNIPCVMYGQKKEPFHFTIDAHDFANKRRYITESTILELNIDGEKRYGLLKDVQENLLTDTILHIDFYEVIYGVEIRAKVKLVLEGTPIGVRNGGVLEQLAYDVEVECLPRHLPDSIKVDVNNLDVNTSLLLKDVPAVKNVKFLDDAESIIATIKYVKADTPTATPEAAATATTAGAAESSQPEKK